MPRSPALALVAAGTLLLSPAAHAEERGDGDLDARLEAAGLAGARLLPGVELAAVAGEGGRRFIVIGGLDRMSALGTALAPERLARPDRADAPQAGADAAEAIDEAAELGLRLADLLAEAGFDDPTPLEDARAAELFVGGWPLHIFFGWSEAD
jgi:hypothetical protein